MLGVAAAPAVIQAVLMFTLPESPRWLFRKVALIIVHTFFFFFQVFTLSCDTYMCFYYVTYREGKRKQKQY